MFVITLIELPTITLAILIITPTKKYILVDEINQEEINQEEVQHIKE